MLTNPITMMFPMMMLMSMVGMFAGNRGGGGKKAAELNEERKDYFRYLDQLRKDVAQNRRTQQRSPWSGAIPMPGRPAIAGGHPADVGTPPQRPRLRARAHRSGQPPSRHQAGPRRRPVRWRIWSRCRRWRCAGSCAPIPWCTGCPPLSRCARSPPSTSTARAAGPHAGARDADGAVHVPRLRTICWSRSSCARTPTRELGVDQVAAAHRSIPEPRRHRLRRACCTSRSRELETALPERAARTRPLPAQRPADRPDACHLDRGDRRRLRQRHRATAQRSRAGLGARSST